MREKKPLWLNILIFFVLVEIYESTITLQQVVAEASAARCAVPLLPADLLTLYQSASCPDVSIRFLGEIYHAHSTILKARSTYLRKVCLYLYPAVKKPRFQNSHPQKHYVGITHSPVKA